MTPTLTVIQSNWNLTGNKSVSASWNTGDLIVVIGLCETSDSGVNNDDQITTPTATGLTFNSIDTDTLTPGGDHCYGVSWQATAGSSGSGTISTTIGNHAYGMLVVIAAAGTHNGVGGHARVEDATEIASVTVAGPHSAIVEVIGDWNTGDPTGNTYTPAGATGWGAELITGRYTPYRVTWTDQAAGARSYGANATLVGSPPKYNKVIVEIKGIADAQAAAPWIQA